MSFQSTTLAGRRAAEALMADTCRITKPGVGDPVLDPETLEYVDPAPVVVYEGKCRIPKRSASVTTANAGEAAWQIGEYPLDLPFADGSENVASGQMVNYLTAEDPALVGQVFGIIEPDRQSQATARRFRMKQVVGGGS